MAESKYSLRLAAVDAFSSTFGDFGKKAGELTEVVKAQQAKLRELNSQAKDVTGHIKLTEQMKTTELAIGKARVEQTRLGREQTLAANRVGELTTAYGKAVVATKALESSTEASAVDLAYARAEQMRLGKELDAVTAASKRLDTQHDKARASVQALERAQSRERTELTRLDQALTKAGIDTTNLANAQERLKAETSQATAALEMQRAKIDAVSRASSKIDANRSARADLRGQFAETAAVGYLASRPIDQAMKLETAMADVSKVLTFSSDDKQQSAGVQAMAADNLKLASDRKIASAGMTAVDLAKIEYAAGQSGIGKDAKTPEARRTAIMEFTRDAATMGAAFDIDAQTAGETMAGWQASMKLDRGKTLDLADATNYLGNNFNAKSADIASVVKRYGAVGSASGMKPEQTAALSAALLNPGTEKEIAGTGFKNFLSALTAGDSATKAEKKQWKELGFDPADLAAEMQRDAPATIMTVLNAIKDQPKEEQAAIATNLFGSESIGAIQPLIENLEPLSEAFKMVADKSKYATSELGDQASMMQEAEGVAKTSRTSWNAFTARLTRLSTVVGNAMLPALNAVLVPLGAVVDGLSWMAETFPNVTGALAVAAGGLAALKVGALGLKFVGLLLGQAFNKAGLARAKLDSTTARTASTADAAVARLNAAVAKVATTGGLAGSGGDGPGKKGKGKGRRLGARVARAGRIAGRVAIPLAVATSAIEAINGAQAGDSEAVGSGIGGAAGSMGGAWGGGLAGASIGTMIFPGVGTAIGGAIGSLVGGLAGGELGSWVGEKGGQFYNWITSSDDEKPEAKKADEVPIGQAAAMLMPGLPVQQGSPLLGSSGVVASALAPIASSAQATPGIASVSGRPMLLPSLSVSQVASAALGQSAVNPIQVFPGAPSVAAAPGIAGVPGLPGLPVLSPLQLPAPAAMAPVLSEPDSPGFLASLDSTLGSLGNKLSEMITGLTDRLSAPDAVQQQVAQASDNRQITFSPTITVNGADQATTQSLMDKILASLQSQFVPMMGGDALSIRRSASLNDGSAA